MSRETFKVTWREPFEPSWRCSQEDKERTVKALERELKRKPGKPEPPPKVTHNEWGKGRCLFCLEPLLSEPSGQTGYTDYEYPRGPRGGYRKPVQKWVTKEIHKPDCIGIKRMRALQALTMDEQVIDQVMDY